VKERGDAGRSRRASATFLFLVNNSLKQLRWNTHHGGGDSAKGYKQIRLTTVKLLANLEGTKTEDGVWAVVLQSWWWVKSRLSRFCHDLRSDHPASTDNLISHRRCSVVNIFIVEMPSSLDVCLSKFKMS
jgi:hypothetical protein